jgi:phage terminase large subunit
VGEQDEYGTPLEKPKLLIDHSCENVIREFNNYRAAKPSGAPNAKEVALKVDDHALDAIRYGLMHLFELGAKHHLSETVSIADVKTTEGTFFNTGVSF